MSEYKYLVCAIFLTYNQKEYIRQALHSVASQKTDFPIVIALVDDASCDGTVEIIHDYIADNYEVTDLSVAYENETEYAHVTYAQHKTNRNCYIAALYLKENHYQSGRADKKLEYIAEWMDNSKYITTCEGDDWWTDDLKLQKLASFLETHPKYVLACHRYNRYIQNENRYEADMFSNKFFGHKKGVSFGRYFNRFVNWRTQTLATIYRGDILMNSIKNYPYSKSDGILSYFPLKYGKGYCFNEHMAIYRVNDGGVFSGLTQMERCYGNWLMFRDFDRYENSFFSKISFFDAYISLMKLTKWKEYKEARPDFRIYLIFLIIYPSRFIISLFYKILYILQK